MKNSEAFAIIANYIKCEEIGITCDRGINCEDCTECEYNYSRQDFTEACRILVELAGKQIPRNHSNRNGIQCCPACGCYVNMLWHLDYCGKCGQRFQ